MNYLWVILGSLIVGFLVAFVVCYFLPKEKIKTTNQELEKKEQATQLRIKDLENDYLVKEKEYQNRYLDLQTEQQKIQQQIQQDKDNWEKEKNNSNLELLQQTKNLEVEVRGLQERRENIIQTLEKEAKESGQIFKDQQIQIAEEQVELARRQMVTEFNKAQEKAKQEYLDLLNETMESYCNQREVSIQELEALTQKLNELQSKVNAAVAANKRMELDRQQKDFYRLQLSDIDIEEIAKIRSIENYLRDKEPLNKVIWKVYYEKPYTDLIGRVVGNKKKTGIYKITNMENGMCYVGQAVDIADRWKQHIRRGIGADPPTRNKLYPAMLEIGVENFTFEVIEECESKDLSSREDSWQAFYHAKDFGYSIK